MTDATAILVTGAGGFIGGVTARHLAAGGASVRGATRDGRAVGQGIAPCAADVRDPASLDAALRGVGAVVHCAYGDAATTIGGTRNVLDAARRGGVRRVVHLSSIAVYGSAAGAVPESTKLLPPEGRGYAHCKAAAEAACRAAKGIEVAILRPAIVYGPGSAQWVQVPARRLLGGGWPDLGQAGLGVAGLVHVSDVASACAAALHAPGAAGEAFNIVGPEILSWRDWYARLAAALGLATLPRSSLAAWKRRMLMGIPLKVAARLLPLAPLRAQADRAPTPSELRLFALNATYPTDKAQARLDWRPAIGLDDGLRDCVAWLRATGIAA